jgi:hypothetical protein
MSKKKEISSVRGKERICVCLTVPDKKNYDAWWEKNLWISIFVHPTPISKKGKTLIWVPFPMNISEQTPVLWY